MSRLLPLPRDCRLLEIGCGYGNALRSLAAATDATTVVGADINEGALHQAHALGIASTFHLAAADAAWLPFGDASIDLIVDFGTLYHVKDQCRCLAEIERVLRVGGMLVYETRLAQALAHPSSLKRGGINWKTALRLEPRASAGLWAARCRTVKVSSKLIG